MAGQEAQLSKSEWRQVSQIAGKIGWADCTAGRRRASTGLPEPIVRFACAAQRSDPDETTRLAAIGAGLNDRTADALQQLLRVIAI